MAVTAREGQSVRLTAIACDLDVSVRQCGGARALFRAEILTTTRSELFRAEVERVVVCALDQRVRPNAGALGLEASPPD